MRTDGHGHLYHVCPVCGAGHDNGRMRYCDTHARYQKAYDIARLALFVSWVIGMVAVVVCVTLLLD